MNNKRRGSANPPSAEALERKMRSIAQLRAQGIPFIEWLPCVEDSETCELRGKDEVVDRLLALCYVRIKAGGGPPDVLASVDRRYRIAAKLSRLERRFAWNPSPSEAEMIDFSWRAEGVWTLFWTLGFKAELGTPTAQCDPETVDMTISSHSEDSLRQVARLIAASEILDKLDLQYRCLWASRRARVAGQAAPAGPDEAVAAERVRALNWVTGYGDKLWDDVSIDS